MKKKGKRGRAADSIQAGSLAHAAALPIDRWQSLLLAAMVALLVARPLVPEDPGGQNGYGAPLDVLWLVLACGWFLGQLRRGNLRLRFGWPDALVLALVGWHTMSALIAWRVGSPRPATNVLWEWIGLGTLFILARQIIRTAREAGGVIVVMLGLACGLSAMAVHQYFVTIPSDVRSYEAARDSTETLYEQTGQWLPPGSSVRQQFENRLNSRLPGATFALSNSLAGFVVPWCVILFAIVLAAGRPSSIVAGVGGLALMAACILLTGSRSAGIAVIVGAMLVGADVSRDVLRSVRRWQWYAITVVLAFVVVAAVVIGGAVECRQVFSAAQRSVAFRVDYWRATLAMIRDFPIWGVGPGQFQDYYATYKVPGASEVVQDPHNWLLDVWANAGSPAVILLLAVLASVMARAFHGARFTHDEAPGNQIADGVTAPDAAVFGGAAGVALGTAIAWLSGFPIARTHMVLLVVGVVGAWWIWRGSVQEGGWSRRLPLIAVIALLVNLLAAGGIGNLAVAGSLWLLFAIQLNIADAWAARAAEGTAGNSHASLAANWIQSKIGRWVVGAALAAVLAAAMWTEYLPVMGCRLQLSIADAAMAAGRSDQRRTALEAAIAADPWSSEAAVRLAEQRFADYQALPTSTQRRSLLEADALARRLAPQSSNVWAQSAEHEVAIHSHTASVEDWEAANRYFWRALELFPSSSELHAKAAKFWDAAGKTDHAREAAVEAIRLDDLMRAGGHTDRLLDATLRQEMEAIIQKKD